MRNIILLLGIIFCFTSFSGKPKPVSIIFDTDIAPDYDDVGAMAILHALADKGEANILATISCNAFKTTAPTISVINTYFNRPDVPVGVVKATGPSYPCERLYAEGIISKFPHSVKSNADAANAVTLYRKVLSSQPDKSVTIVTVGFFTNLADLLESLADEYSPLNGQQLVSRKVKQLVSMAGRIDSSNSGYEFNVMGDIGASQKVFSSWPTPITLSGFEIGEKIFTGARLVNNPDIENSPIKEAYNISLQYDHSPKGRYSWDQTAVLVAVRGTAPYFNYRKLNLAVKDDGKDTVITGKRITYLSFKQTPEEIGKLVEDLMMHEPNKK